VTHYDPNTDPTRPATGEPVFVETVETVVVRESNTGWWIAGVLGGAVLIAVMWILFSGQGGNDADARVLEAEAEAAAAQAQADRALMQGQMTGAQASIDIARADAARAQADAVRAESEARAAEARTAAPPTVIVTPAPQPAPSTGSAVITSTTPQP